MPEDEDEKAPRVRGLRPEDQPTERMDPRTPPLVTADLSSVETVDDLPGALPENAGRDPGDSHRDEQGRGELGKIGRRPVE